MFAKIDSVSEIQAIGFSDGSHELRYALFGSEGLNIEQWIPVYQGVNPIGGWASYRLPIGNDWLAWHDTLQLLMKCILLMTMIIHKMDQAILTLV